MNMFELKFSDLIQIAITTQDDDLLKDAFLIQDYVDEDLYIRYVDNSELLEDIVRALTRIDIKTGLLAGTFTVLDCPEESKVYTEWMIKAFAYLESEVGNWVVGDEVVYPCNEHHKDVIGKLGDLTEVQLAELSFLYSEINVEFNSNLEGESV